MAEIKYKDTGIEIVGEIQATTFKDAAGSDLLGNINKQTATLNHGLQSITTDQDTPLNVTFQGRTLVNLGGVFGRTATSATITVTSAKYYLVINEDMSNVTVGGTSRVVPYKVTGVTSLAMSWSTGKVAVYEVDSTTYAKIGVDADYTGSAILTLFPYVDSVQHLTNAFVRANADTVNESYLYVLTTLAEGETLQEIDGQQVKTKKWQTGIKLDGSFAWVFATELSGFKKVKITGFLPSTASNLPNLLSKPNGNMASNYANGDGAWVGIGDTTLYVSCLDTESGWGETYTPLAAEMKAYFYGYRMNNGTFGTPYDGTGTKTWAKMSATDNTGAVTVCPTTQAVGEGNYTLHYQLATPVTEAVQVEGGLSLINGANQVELDEGVIARELVAFNAGTKQGTTAYRSAKVIDVYKNGSPEQFTTYASSGQTLPQLVNAVDATASYTVTYIALDKYLLTNNAITATGEYQTNLRTVVTEVVADLANVQTDVTMLKNTTAKKQQGQWIAPTLLNAWVNFGGGLSDAGYLKDEIGFIHLKGLVKSGTLGSAPVFILPAGYRPKNTMNTITISYNGTANVISYAQITTAGELFASGANNWFSLEGITFRAEL